MATIKTLKDTAGNIVYPQTRIEAVYNGSGTSVDTLIDNKVTKVASPITGNVPKLTSDGQLEDSGVGIDELQEKELPIVSASDKGKILAVNSSGQWMAAEPATFTAIDDGNGNVTLSLGGVS